MVYAWFLRTGRTYEAAWDFFDTLLEPEQIDKAPPEADGQITHEIQATQQVQSQEELCVCYINNLERYFSLRMPSSRDRSGYAAVQKLFKNNWPNTTALKNIRNRKEDVPRKLLLLLYVVAENVLDGDYHELDEEYITMQERLEDHWQTLNAILTDCGMPTLDPRNPTDWLVFYALTAADESMSERMEQVIEETYD